MMKFELTKEDNDSVTVLLDGVFQLTVLAEQTEEMDNLNRLSLYLDSLTTDRELLIKGKFLASGLGFESLSNDSFQSDVVARFEELFKLTGIKHNDFLKLYQALGE